MNIIMWLVKVMTMRVYECSNVLSSPGHPPGGLVGLHLCGLVYV